MGVASFIIECHEDFEAQFAETYHRPSPWIEVPNEEERQRVAWNITQTAGFHSGADGLEGAIAKLSGLLDLSRNDTLYYGSTEPLKTAIARLRLPADGRGVIVDESTGSTTEYLNKLPAVIIDYRDLIEFEGIFWRDNQWLIDEQGRWALYGPHDQAAQCFRHTRR